MRATIPRCRAVRARVGVLEDVRGATGDNTWASDRCDDNAWERFIRGKTPRGRVVREKAELSILQRLGAPEDVIFVVQGNIAVTYELLGRGELAIRLKRDVYSGNLKLFGEEHFDSLTSANNYASSLVELGHFKEAKALMRKTIPVVRRVLGENHDLILTMRWNYAEALYKDDGATLDDLREAVTTLDGTGQTARRVLGGAHPITKGIERELQMSRAALRAYEDTAPGVSGIRKAVEAMTAGDA